jgi:hypothetical protein
MLTRYFHLRVGEQMTGGATIKVTQTEDDFAHVQVQSTRCSRSDVYRRAKGREYADCAPIIKVTLRDLPNVMANIHRKACKECGKALYAARPDELMFAVKYFLPKV